MSRVGPQYFDNELISANIRRVRNGEGMFSLEVDVHPSDLKKKVRKKLELEQKD